MVNTDSRVTVEGMQRARAVVNTKTALRRIVADLDSEVHKVNVTPNSRSKGGFRWRCDTCEEYEDFKFKPEAANSGAFHVLTTLSDEGREAAIAAYAATEAAAADFDALAAGMSK